MGHHDQDTAGVIAFPPLIYGMPLIAGVILDRVLGRRPLPLAALALSVGCFAGAVSLVAPSFAAFKARETPVDPFEETTALVESGPYAGTRNPIYLGLTLAYAGIALAARTRTPFAFLPVVLWIMNAGVIDREERYLQRKFGDEYRGYKERVPRWL